MEHWLTQLGLTAGEARVYLALLQLGSSRASDLVKRSTVSSSKIYFVLERLIAHGLVSTVKFGGVSEYQAVSPFRLSELLDQKEAEVNRQRQQLEQYLPRLEELTTFAGQTSAEIFVGLRGIQTAYEILLDGVNRYDVLRFIFPYRTPPTESVRFYQHYYPAEKSRCVMRGLARDGWQDTDAFSLMTSDKLELKFVDMALPSALDMVGDKILLITWTSTPTAILIQSAEMSDHYASYFDGIWNNIE